MASLRRALSAPDVAGFAGGRGGAGWFDADRVRAWGVVFAAAMLMVLVGAYSRILAPVWQDPPGRPVASDFDPFWSGARLALRGTPALAYDGDAIRAEENTGAALPRGQVMLYQYPPSFQLLCLPLALLPYLLALLIFLGGSYAVCMLALARLRPRGWPVLPLLACPGAVTNAIIGQNAFLSGGLFGGAALWLEERPLLAGACLGGFACKPHLAIAVPVALMAARRWRALAAASVTGSAIMLASLVVPGPAAWRAFLQTLWVSRAILQSEETGPKVVTVYAAVRLLHGGDVLAAAVQAVAAVLAIALVGVAVRRRPGGLAEIALCVTAGLLAIPYAMDYDLFLLAIPLLWLAGEASRHGWRPGEKPLLLACFVLPLVVRTVNLRLGVPLAPPLLALLFGAQMTRIAGAAEKIKSFWFFFFRKRTRLSSFSEEKEAKRLLFPRGSGGIFWRWRRELLAFSWLTEERARAYARIVAVASLVFAGALAAIFVAGARHDARGLSYSCDFNAFWSAARFAVQGHPGQAYVPAAMRAMQMQNAQPIAGGGFIHYPYPPIFQLLTLPLGALPFRYALPIFVLGGIGVFFLAMRSLLPRSWPAISILAAPAVMVDAASTQNGWISATLFCAGARFLETRPALAGALLGGLAFKPQLAMCVPLGLLAARRWRALLAFAASIGVMSLLAWAVLGSEAWLGFLHSLPMSGAIGQTRPNWGTGQSLYAAVRILGGGSAAGFAVQALMSMAALGVVVALCRRRPGGAAEMAVIAAATMAATPYVLDYDFMSLLPALAVVASAACRTGWRPGEKPVLALVYLYPFVARNLALASVPLGPLVLALCLFTVTQRAAKP